jgi:ATP-dependent RNA helicase SUPV3L1/SUV3
MAEIWWPKDTGPFRQQSQHQKPRKKFHHSQKAKPPESSPADPPHKPARPEVRKPQKPERPVVNPDSPFAVLGVLRSQLAEKKNA